MTRHHKVGRRRHPPETRASSPRRHFRRPAVSVFVRCFAALPMRGDPAPRVGERGSPRPDPGWSVRSPIRTDQHLFTGARRCPVPRRARSRVPAAGATRPGTREGRAPQRPPLVMPVGRHHVLPPEYCRRSPTGRHGKRPRNAGRRLRRNMTPRGREMMNGGGPGRGHPSGGQIGLLRRARSRPAVTSAGHPRERGWASAGSASAASSASRGTVHPSRPRTPSRDPAIRRR